MPAGKSKLELPEQEALTPGATSAHRAGPGLKRKRDPTGAYLAVCLVVKDQSEDLREWLDYHRRLGVGKFYIFDDNSSVLAATVMEDLIVSGDSSHPRCNTAFTAALKVFKDFAADRLHSPPCTHIDGVCFSRKSACKITPFHFRLQIACCDHSFRVVSPTVFALSD